MDFGFYVVDTWGDKLGGGTAADPQYCTLEGIAKLNSTADAGDQAPYAVTNEFICGRLALIIGLPVPPGVIVTADDDKLAYVSLRFGPKGELPPPANIPHLVEDHPSIAAGVVAFDCWIGNQDRHDRNIAYQRGSAEHSVTVFDHSHALLGHQRGKAAELLRQQIGSPLIAGSVAPAITSSAGFVDWANRINTVSDGLIRELCRAVVHPDGIAPEERDAAEEFLIQRKGRILEMIQASKGVMSNVQQWELPES